MIIYQNSDNNKQAEICLLGVVFLIAKGLVG